MLGFTAANREAVMCTVIFAAKTFWHEWQIGFNPFVEWVGGEEDIACNCGDNKPYPFGLSCLVREKQVPCYCCCIESVGILGVILKYMLAYLDSLDLFDRSTGLNPFLILDGHGSRFKFDFLEYINSNEHKWNVNIGLPYGTSYWQVGDSTKQNGCLKMALAKEKKACVTKK